MTIVNDTISETQAEEKPKLISDEVAKAVLKEVKTYGDDRAKNFGADFHDDDFIAGVGAVFTALGQWNKVPVEWILGCMSGRDVFGPNAGRAASRDARPRRFRYKDVEDLIQNVKGIASTASPRVQACLLDAIDQIEETW